MAGAGIGIGSEMIGPRIAGADGIVSMMRSSPVLRIGPISPIGTGSSVYSSCAEASDIGRRRRASRASPDAGASAA